MTSFRTPSVETINASEAKIVKLIHFNNIIVLTSGGSLIGVIAPF